VSAGWRCLSCGADNPEGTRFCGQCGTRLGASAPAEATPDLNAALRNFVHRQVADRITEGGGQIAEERRLVTALFADISGFTPLADRLDPEQLLEVIDPIISRLSSVVGRYEGYVDKFAGDALLAFFGAPVSHEDDAVRAVLVALDMHREMQSLVDQLGPDAAGLTLHVGVNTGHVIARIIGSDVRLDYSVLGDAVILAQRLESAAPGGQTYVGEATHRLVSHHFDFESVGDLALKGKAQPVPAWRLIGERAQPRPLRGDGNTMVGRQDELSRISAALDQLRAGTGGVVSILGDPGVGKSRLLQAVQEMATRHGVRWLDARCLSYGSGLDYWPFADLVRRLYRIRREMPAAEARQRLRDAPVPGAGAGTQLFLERLLGIAADANETNQLEPEAFRRGLHDAITEFLQGVAAAGPVALVLEDVHWADMSTLDLTADLVRKTPTSPILFVLSGRPEAKDRVREVAELRPEATRGQVVLEALDPDGVQVLLTGLLGGSPEPGLVSLLSDRTGGNPFFIEETVRSLGEEGVLIQRGDRWGADPRWQPDSVPPTIEGVIAARLDRLPRPEVATLEMGSVIGRTVRRPLLEAVATEIPDLEGSIDHLVEGGFLDQRLSDPERSVTFHHALVQNVAYNRMLRKRRRELHLRVADAAEAIYGSADDFIDLLARHLFLGGAGVRAFDALLRAADRAKRLFANQEAIVHLRSALEVARALPELAARRPAVLLDLAKLEERVGSYDGALEFFKEVREETNEIDAWQGMAAVLRKQGRYDEALELIQAAFERLAGQAVDARGLWHERAWTMNVAGRFKEARAAADEGLRLGSREDPVAGYLLLQLTRADTVEERFDDAIQDGLDAQRIFEAHDHAHGLATCLRALGNAYSAAGQLEMAERVLRRGLQLAEQIGNAEDIGGALTNLGLVLLERGSLDEAIQCDRRAIEEFERSGHGSGRTTAYANLAEKLAAKGAYAEALSYCDRSLRLAEAIHNPYVAADARATRATILLRTGSYPEAASEFERAGTLFRELGATQRASTAFAHAAEAVALS